jgi:hypothetical protein
VAAALLGPLLGQAALGLLSNLGSTWAGQRLEPTTQALTHGVTAQAGQAMAQGLSWGPWLGIVGVSVAVAAYTLLALFHDRAARWLPAGVMRHVPDLSLVRKEVLVLDGDL